MTTIRRTLIIGIDGGTLDILRPLTIQGLMPNLAGMLSEGAHGNLISTTPPITGPAWRSFATGCNPGKHGVIDFVRLDPGTKRVHITEVSQSSLPTLWGVLSDAGVKVAVMGVPMTYPVQPVNGVLLTGMMTPPGSRQYSFPHELAEELESHNLDWIISEGEKVNAHRAEAYVAEIRADMRKRVDTALHILEQESPTFATFVFGATDPLQHQFMDAILENDHPDHGILVDFYRELDKQIGRLLDWAGQDTLVIMMSDHGFGRLDGFIHLNNWLLDRGYLQLRRDTLTRLRRGLHRWGFTPENLYGIARRLGLDFRRRLNRGRVFSIARLVFLSFENVDWNATRAYSLGHIGQVYISRKPPLDSEVSYQEFRTELKKNLEGMIHPDSREQMIDRVFFREEIYSGPLLDAAPDLLLHPAGFRYVAFGESEFASNRTIGPALHQGHHRMEGLLIMRGPGIRKAISLPDHRIEDIMPTALYSLDVPIPTYLDGALIGEAFAQDYLSRNRPRSIEQDLPTSGSDKSRSYSEDEEELLRERLHKLGYLA